jgi:hypothetical protein
VSPPAPPELNRSVSSMDLTTGFQIESPNVFVAWGVRPTKLKSLLTEHGLKRVTHGYYTLSCVSLNGLSHDLGFHFRPRWGGILNELEFFHRSYKELEVSFEEFQKHFEAAFGKPTNEQPGDQGLPSFCWNFASIQIVHYVLDRFGPEEHMRIRKL